MEKIENPEIKKEGEDIYSNVLFVADLPNETTNEDLQAVFKDYHFQFASLNNYKNNGVWAQVYLESKEWADKARHELNGYIFKPINSTKETKIKPIRICKYEVKTSNKQTNIKQNLLIKNIDINVTQKELYDKFLEFGDIASGKIEYDENGISKGYGYIYYFTEEAAENAKKNLNGKSFYGKSIEIVNLIPTKKNKNNIITLFVLNIPKDVTEEKLSSIFEKFGPVSNISINPNGYAYISYYNFESATKCLNQMKDNPFSFPGLPNIVVKFARAKEERDNKKNNQKNILEKNDLNSRDLNVQFNYLYYNQEIKTDLDLDKEIRLFIKVVMLMDYSPKEVLVDFESMSGLVSFDNNQDYILFFKKYQEFCSKQLPVFECIPYEIPINNRNIINNNMNNQNPYFNQNQMQNNNRYFYDMQRKNNNQNMKFNNKPMYNNNMPMPQYNGMNPGFNYMNKVNQKDPRFMGNNNYKNNNYVNNNKIAPMNYNNNKMKDNNDNKNNMMYNRNNNNNTYNMRRDNNNNPFNNNQQFIFKQNYGNSYNININMNPGMNPNMNPGMNPNMNPNMNQKMNPNMMQMNPYFKPQMMMYNNRFNNPNMNNYRFNNNPNKMNAFQNKNNNMDKNKGYAQRNWYKNQDKMNNNQINQKYNKNNENNDNNNDDNDIDVIDERNLQNLNPSQLLSQFNKPPINIYNEEMFNFEEKEDLVNEIADAIYEIVYAKYPKEASKITGMIREKGYQKMNLLLSKQEDLNEIIEKAYKMIKSNDNQTEGEHLNDNEK